MSGEAWKEQSRHKCIRRDEVCSAEFLVYRPASGGRVARPWCERCNCNPPTWLMKKFAPLAEFSAEAITNMREWDEVVPGAKDEHRECAHCGKVGRVECHHWAPKHLFADADQWPQSYLCGPCHQLWHATMTPSMSATNGVRQTRLYVGPAKMIGRGVK
jgi:hypothetical protein